MVDNYIKAWWLAFTDTTNGPHSYHDVVVPFASAVPGAGESALRSARSQVEMLRRYGSLDERVHVSVCVFRAHPETPVYVIGEPV